jgi:hypothetical protein
MQCGACLVHAPTSLSHSRRVCQHAKPMLISLLLLRRDCSSPNTVISARSHLPRGATRCRPHVTRPITAVEQVTYNDCSCNDVATTQALPHPTIPLYCNNTRGPQLHPAQRVPRCWDTCEKHGEHLLQLRYAVQATSQPLAAAGCRHALSLCAALLVCRAPISVHSAATARPSHPATGCCRLSPCTEPLPSPVHLQAIGMHRAPAQPCSPAAQPPAAPARPIHPARSRGRSRTSWAAAAVCSRAHVRQPRAWC